MNRLGTVVVSGRSRVPSPPTRMTACTATHRRDPKVAPDALVAQPGRLDRLGVERVAAVDDELARHRVRHLAPVEVLELLPLRDEDHRVGVAHALQRGGGELHALTRLRASSSATGS